MVKELLMNIVLANDHGAVELKNAIMASLMGAGTYGREPGREHDRFS